MKTIIITAGLQRDEEQGDLGAVLLGLPRDKADEILKEQAKSVLLQDEGALKELLNQYAKIHGYECAYFLRADVDPSRRPNG